MASSAHSLQINHFFPRDSSKDFRQLKFQKLKICTVIRRNFRNIYRRLEIMGNDKSSDHKEVSVRPENPVSESLLNGQC